APSRTGVTGAMSGESAKHQPSPASDASCRGIDISVLVGIKRSEQVAALGPPTWCQRSDPFGYVSGDGGDCESHHTPMWSSESTAGAPGGLMCQSDASDRCLHLT